MKRTTLSILLACAMSSWFRVHATDPPPKPRPSPREKTAAEIYGTTIQFHYPVYDRLGVLQYEILGEKAKRNRKSKYDVISKPIVHAYQYGKSGGRKTSKTGQTDLYAEWGYRHRKTGDLKFVGNVRLIFHPSTPEEIRVLTEKLFWDLDRHYIHTDQPVKVEKRDVYVEGTGMEMFQEQRWLRILDDVYGVIHKTTTSEGAEDDLVDFPRVDASEPKDQDVWYYSCDGPLYYYRDANIVKLFDNVILFQQDRQMLSDIAVLFFQPHGEGLQTIHGYRNAYIATPDRKLEGDRFFWHMATDSGKLLGAPGASVSYEGMLFEGPIVEVSAENKSIICREGGTIELSLPGLSHR